MKTPKRILLVALTALGLAGTLALAQDAPPTAPPAVEKPATPPAVERPAPPPAVERPTSPGAVEAPTPPTVEAPTVEAPDTATDDGDDEPRIVWDRNRERAPWERRGSQDEIVTIGGSSTLESGRRADAVVSIFGSSTSRGEVRDAVVSVFGNTRIESGEVRDAAVAVLGNNYVNAPVGEVVAVMGNVELGPKAVVSGEVVIIGGTLTRDPAAIVRGGVQHVLGFPEGMMSGLQAWARSCLAYLRPLAFAPGIGWAWAIALGFLGLYVLIGAMFREPVDRCVKTIQEQPGQTVLASILTMLAVPVVLTILGITVIGIPFVPLAGFAIFIATLFGKAVVLAWIGRSILRSFDEEERLNTALPILLGGAIILLLYVVPVLGFIVYNVFGILALGVVVYTLLLRARERRRNAPPPAGLGPRPSVPPGSEAPTGAATGMSSESMSASATSAYGATPAAGSAPAYDSSGTAGAAFTASANPDGTSGASYTSGADPAFAGASAGFAGNAPEGGVAGGPESGGGGMGGGSNEGRYGAAYAGGPSPRATTMDALSAPRAGFWIRMLALLIDGVIIGVAFSILLDEPGRLQLIALAAYGAIMWKLKGTTVGGIVCNLKVVRLDGREIDWSTAIVRALGCFLSLIILGLGFIWIAFDEGKQSWHDKIAGTAVVRVPQGVSLL